MADPIDHDLPDEEVVIPREELPEEADIDRRKPLRSAAEVGGELAQDLFKRVPSAPFSLGPNEFLFESADGRRLYIVMADQFHLLDDYRLYPADARSVRQKYDIAKPRHARREFLRPEINLTHDSLNRLAADQYAWSLETFSQEFRTSVLLDHIVEEVIEVGQDPQDLFEWIDIALLAIDGYCRNGGNPERLLQSMRSKFTQNQSRKWDPQTGKHIK